MTSQIILPVGGGLCGPVAKLETTASSDKIAEAWMWSRLMVVLSNGPATTSNDDRQQRENTGNDETTPITWIASARRRTGQPTTANKSTSTIVCFPSAFGTVQYSLHRNFVADVLHDVVKHFGEQIDGIRKDES